MYLNMSIYHFELINIPISTIKCKEKFRTLAWIKNVTIFFTLNLFYEKNFGDNCNNVLLHGIFNF